MKKQSEKSRIKELRKILSISQVEMADELGVSQQSISRMENYPEKMPVDLLISISKRYGISIDYLLGLTNIKTINSIYKADDNEEAELPVGFSRLFLKYKFIINLLIKALLLLQSTHDQK